MRSIVKPTQTLLTLMALFLSCQGVRADDSLFSPLSSDRYLQLDQLNRQYEIRHNYGLMDNAEESAYLRGYNDNRTGYLNEILSRESTIEGNQLKSNIQANVGDTAATRSAIYLGTAYLFTNGKVIRSHLSDSTELNASAKAIDRSGTVGLSVKKLPLDFKSGVSYHIDPTAQTTDASLTHDLLPHLTAAIDQKRTVMPGNAPINESTGSLRYGIGF